MLIVDWIAKIISVPKSYTILVQSSPIEIRRLDIDIFRLDLKDLEDSEEGMVYPDTHQHNTTITVGGVTLARVIEMINGYTITFEDGNYAVNLVGANSNIADVVNLNQVSIRSGNSAGLIDLPAIRLQSFIGARIYIDTVVGAAGTVFPKGTPPFPVDNFDDAHAIEVLLNLTRYNLRGDIIFQAGDDLVDSEWFGASFISASLVFSGQEMDHATFHQMGLTGQFNGRATFECCSFGSVTDFAGVAIGCCLDGDVTLDSADAEDVLFKNCTSLGVVSAVLDCNGSSGKVHLSNWVGGIIISNFSASNEMVIDCTTGTIELDSSCTAGVIKVRMNAASASLIDNSGAGCTVIVESITTSIEAKIDTIDSKIDTLPADVWDETL